VLCEPGYERAVGEAIARTLSDPLHVAEWLTQNSVRHWDRIGFDAVSRDDRMMQILLTELERRSNLVHRRPAPSCWQVGLPASWDDYLTMLSKSHRKQLRRLQREFFESGRAVIHHARCANEFEYAWELLARLHERRQRSQGKVGSFASRRYSEFHRAVAQQLLQTGKLRLDWLEVDGQPLAVDYYLAGKKTLYAYQGGIDPDGLDYSPGQMILSATLQRAIAEGYRYFDFLRGDEPFKAHWRAEPKPVEDVRVIPRTASNRVRHGLWIASDHVKHWLKSSFRSTQV
jgi:CelD/BcsL family acetyltransferase involved in cellulose biosynthesis